MLYPYLICHMMTTIDGRIVAEGWNMPHRGLSDLADLVEFNITVMNQLEADANLLGRKTVHKDLCQKLFDPTGLPRTKHPNIFKGELISKLYRIILDPFGKTLYDSSMLADQNIIAVLSERVSDQYLKHLRQLGISYIFSGLDGRDLDTAMRTLALEFNIKRIALQGSAAINGAF